MLDNGLLPRMKEPIQMRLRNGMFYADVRGHEIFCSIIEGRFKGIVHASFKGFPYYALQLQDETNLYQVLFTPKAAILRYLVLCMAGEEFSYVVIEGYEDDGRSRMRLYLDGKSTCPNFVELPKIKRVRDGKGKPYYCVYDALLDKMAEIIERINKCNTIQPACVELHQH